MQTPNQDSVEELWIKGLAEAMKQGYKNTGQSCGQKQAGSRLKQKVSKKAGKRRSQRTVPELITHEGTRGIRLVRGLYKYIRVRQ